MDDILKKEIINNINEHGYYILKNYYSTSYCNKICKDIKINIEKYKKINGEGKDIRLYNYNKQLESIIYINNQDFIDIGSKIIGHKIEHKRCQAGILTYNSTQSCSGGGWHVDNLKPQFKTILYLTDVNEDNGAFSILSPPYKIEDITQNLIYKNTRIINEPLCEEFEEKYKKNIKIITGNIGDVILVNTNYIHRGMIIKKGERLTLTNYYL